MTRMVLSLCMAGAFLAGPISRQDPVDPPQDLALSVGGVGSPAPDRAVIHDNDRAAGTLEGGILRVHLRAVEADWRPMGEDQPGAVVYAFAEGSGPPMIPSPHLRVPLGTEIRATIENTLDSVLVVRGLTERVRTAPRPVVVLPGERVEVRFTADAPGTYPYWGRVAGTADEAGPNIRDRDGRDVPLSGAFVVDPPGEGREAHEEVMVITMYGHRYPGTDQGSALHTINGRPWPHTRRLEYTQGDSVRWRIVNAAERGHPMHLHGFFFRVDAKGDLARDTLFWESERRMAVTEEMPAGSSLTLTWSPDRPGGWVFHCHIAAHVQTSLPLGDAAPDRDQRLREILLGDPHHDPDHHVEEGMGGLMVAVDVLPGPGWTPDERERRVIRAAIVSDSLPAEAGTPLEITSPHRRRFSMVVDRPGSGSGVPFPGEALVLEEGEPTTIWVVNRSPEPTSIHWHGLELESLYDGVVGVGGYLGSRTPAVLPGDSFQVRITPPRSGSFMYHTHMSDVRQQGGGLYGPFVVVPDRSRWDRDRDRIFLLGNGPHAGGVFMNGETELAEARMDAGEPYRLRFMNITLNNNGVRVLVVRDGYPARWTPLAKDGADLPGDWRDTELADFGIRVGETADFLFEPEAGEYTVEVRAGGGRLLASQRILVEGPGPAR